jgi:hypothetical protein
MTQFRICRRSPLLSIPFSPQLIIYLLSQCLSGQEDIVFFIFLETRFLNELLTLHTNRLHPSRAAF